MTEERKIINKKLRILKKDILDISNMVGISEFIFIDDITEQFKKLQQKRTEIASVNRENWVSPSSNGGNKVLPDFRCQNVKFELKR